MGACTLKISQRGKTVENGRGRKWPHCSKVVSEGSRRPTKKKDCYVVIKNARIYKLKKKDKECVIKSLPFGGLRGRKNNEMEQDGKGK